MRCAKIALAAMAAVLLVTGQAKANPVQGQVLCEGTTNGVQGVQAVIFDAAYPDWSPFPRPWDEQVYTDAGGSFVVMTDGRVSTALVQLTYGTYTASYTRAIDQSTDPDNVGQFELPASWCNPEEPPPPVCEAKNVTTEPLCMNLRNMKAECGYFGLAPLDKDDGLTGQTWTATKTARLALVKAGGCYRIVENVEVGDQLSSPSTRAISHVTYCGCP